MQHWADRVDQWLDPKKGMPIKGGALSSDDNGRNLMAFLSPGAEWTEAEDLLLAGTYVRKLCDGQVHARTLSRQLREHGTGRASGERSST